MKLLREYTDDDYDTIKGWWLGQTKSAPPEEVLSYEGVIVEGVSAAWLYTGNSAMAFVGWPVINPDVSKVEAVKALGCILAELQRRAKAYGCLVVAAYTSHPALLKLLAKAGFSTGEENVTHMVLGV